MERSAGILLSVSSLPSPYGIGTLGKAAYEFADFLAAAGQKYWQLLPLGPTSYGDSPYQSFSTFAGNPYFIDLDMLIEDELLTEEEVTMRDWGSNARAAKDLTVGDKLRLSGRIQSRMYQKKESDGSVDNRIAYEVSVGKLERY